MLSAIRVFLQASGSKKWLVLACLIGSGFAEGIGIATLLPLVAVMSDQAGATDSRLGQFFTEALGAVGLPNTVGVLLVIICLGAILKGALNVTALRFVGFAVADVTTRVRVQALRGLLECDWSYFGKRPLGLLGGLIGGQATRAGQAFQMSAMMMASVVQCAIYMTGAMLLSLKLALVALAIGVTMSVVLGRYVRQSRRAGAKQTKRTNELGAVMGDTILGIKSLKAMGRYEAFEELIREKIDKLQRSSRLMVSSKETLTNVQEPILMIVLAAGFYILIVVAAVPAAQVLVMGLFLQRTVRTLNRLQQQSQQFAQQESAFTFVMEMIAEMGNHREQHHGTRLPTLERGVTVERLSFAHGQIPVLHDLTLAIPARHLVVLTGESGSGKTTLTDLLLAFYKPNEGRILIDGVPLDEIDIEAWRRMIGYVPQEAAIFRDTIMANVTLRSDEIEETAVIEALKAADAWRFVERLPKGLHTSVGERGGGLSGGQRQRIAIARALVHRPKLLILDEVTSALDGPTERAICTNIARLAREVTVLSISHRPAWKDFADIHYRLEAGRVVERNTARGEAAGLTPAKSRVAAPST